MGKIAAAALVVTLLLSRAALGAEDPVLKLYKDVRLQLQRDPANPTVMMAVRPPIDAKNPAHRKALNEIVTYLETAAGEKADNFHVVHNYRLALWTRFLQLGAEADAAAALEQLETAAKLTEAGSGERARCDFERAQATLALRDKGLTKLLKGDATETAIEEFIAAKRSAMSTGHYAGQSALALASLYAEKGDLTTAKKMAREALELDTGHGYVTNHAYDRFGRILLAEGNADGAVTMLQAAAKAELDEDLRGLGYAHGLAWELIEKGRYAEAVKYLEMVVQRADKGECALSSGVAYALATAYMRQGQSGLALMYWKRYLEMGDADATRRQEAKKIAQDLAIKASQPPPK